MSTPAGAHTARRWTPADMPDLAGRTALVTGVTSGLGEHTALELAGRGAQVVLAARSAERLERSVAAIRQRVQGAALHPLVLDLADLASIGSAVQRIRRLGPLHILVNNAGVMATPQNRTADGFELQLGTNHLGHFALTGLLWPQLLASGGARVVAVSSHAARFARTVSLRDPRQRTPRYRKWTAYAESKLANLLFAFELDRRARKAGAPVTAVAAHPGYSHTGLVNAGMNMGRRTLDGTIADAAGPFIGQSAAMGALPQLMAATAPGLRGGSYLGPDGLLEMRGYPTLVQPPAAALDTHLAAALWELSERATGVHFP